MNDSGTRIGRAIPFFRAIGYTSDDCGQFQDHLEDVDVFATDTQKLFKPKPLRCLAEENHMAIPCWADSAVSDVFSSAGSCRGMDAMKQIRYCTF